jgi:hypothetical protein
MHREAENELAPRRPLSASVLGGSLTSADNIAVPSDRHSGTHPSSHTNWVRDPGGLGLARDIWMSLSLATRVAPLPEYRR